MVARGKQGQSKDVRILGVLGVLGVKNKNIPWLSTNQGFQG
jgi:hypothetical protein